MSVKIYTMTHKKFDVPNDPMYVPLQVGAEGKEPLGYVRDNTGENISALNCYYSELTGVYWIWKNDTESDIVGVCHYRRYLLNEKGVMFRKEEIEKLLSEYDCLTSRLLTLDFSYHYGFSDNHNVRDLDVTGEVIREKYPEDYPLFEKLVHENHTYFGNICVMKKPLFDAYCAWLFDIFAEVRKRIDIDSYDSYHKRVFGFVSEFLLYVWVTKHKLRAYECMVGMIGEKAETKEMKQRLADYFAEKDIVGAKQYFMEMYTKRPDVLMEASDITGDLRICMQIIATAERELATTGGSILDRSCTFEDYMHLFKTLNGIVRRYCVGRQTTKDKEMLAKLHLSEEAVYVSVLAFCKEKEDEESNDDISFKTMFVLAVATSIDALAIGITFAFLKVNLLLAISMIGIITFVISIIGTKVGNKFGSKYEKKAELAGGIILILIGIKILLEHLGIL